MAAAPPPPPQPKVEEKEEAPLGRRVPVRYQERKPRKWGTVPGMSREEREAAKKVLKEQMAFTASALSATSEIGEENVKGDIYNTSWDDVTKVELSGSGSAGCIFVTRESGEKVAVKSNMTPVEEIFANGLALWMNIRVPCVRLVLASGKEWQHLKTALRKVTEADWETRLVVSKSLDRAFFIIMEFVNGRDFLHMPPQELQKVLTPETPLGIRRLRDLGQIISLDAVTNNLDRTPCLWDHWGNLGNLFVTHLSSKVVGIDNGVFSISNADPRKYYDRVEAFVKGLIEVPMKITEPIEKLRTCIQCYSMDPAVLKECEMEPPGPLLPNDCLMEVQVGILEGMCRFAQLKRSHLETLKKSIADAPAGYDWCDVWKKGLVSVNLDFIDGVVEILRTYRSQMMEALSHHSNVKAESTSKAWLLQNPPPL